MHLFVYFLAFFAAAAAPACFCTWCNDNEGTICICVCLCMRDASCSPRCHCRLHALFALFVHAVIENIQLEFQFGSHSNESSHQSSICIGMVVMAGAAAPVTGVQLVFYASLWMRWIRCLLLVGSACVFFASFVLSSVCLVWAHSISFCLICFRWCARSLSIATKSDRLCAYCFSLLFPFSGLRVHCVSVCVHEKRAH